MASHYSEATLRDELKRFSVIHDHDTIVRYILDGVPTGGATQAALEGNLFHAVARSDLRYQVGLVAFVKFLVNCAPAGCYGSQEHYRSWVDRKGLRGIDLVRTCCAIAQRRGAHHCPICQQAVRVIVVHRLLGTQDLVARELPITERQCKAYADGWFLQDAFPNLSPQDREFIKSGFSLEDPPDVDEDPLAPVVDEVAAAIDKWDTKADAIIVVPGLSTEERQEAKQALVYEKALRFVRYVAGSHYVSPSAHDGAWIKNLVDDARAINQQAEEAWPLKSNVKLKESPRDVKRAVNAGMEPNPNGHPYGCGCDECVEFYRSLK